MNAPAATTAFTPAVFLALSSGLMGVSAADLQPAADRTDIVRLFYNAVRDSVDTATLDRLTHTFLSACTVSEGAAEVLIDAQLGPIGRNIVRLWLSGAWHDPAAPAKPPLFVCDERYRQSPVWRGLQAHPVHDHLFGARR